MLILNFLNEVSLDFSDTDAMKVFPVNLRIEEMDICKNLPKLWGLSWISLYANWEASFISSFCQEWEENFQSSDVWLCLPSPSDHMQAVAVGGRWGWVTDFKVHPISFYLIV